MKNPFTVLDYFVCLFACLLACLHGGWIGLAGLASFCLFLRGFGEVLFVWCGLCFVWGFLKFVFGQFVCFVFIFHFSLKYV